MHLRVKIGCPSFSSSSFESCQLKIYKCIKWSCVRNEWGLGCLFDLLWMINVGTAVIISAFLVDPGPLLLSCMTPLSCVLRIIEFRKLLLDVLFIVQPFPLPEVVFLCAKGAWAIIFNISQFKSKCLACQIAAHRSRCRTKQERERGRKERGAIVDDRRKDLGTRSCICSSAH